MDALGDSDEEDLSKMDKGSKKGPLNRWDFETAEEFEEYKSKQEALPKAAFQYGLKTNDGRKTKKSEAAKKEDKGKLERDWKKIQDIWERKRESKGGEGDDGESGKKPRY